MADYDPQILRRLQLTQLSILKDYAAFCDANGLEYFGAYGTLLGAVRHGGFIPWDDDIDIGMPRKDYERFLSLAHGRIGSRYEILDIAHTPGYLLTFAKMSIRDSTFMESTDLDRPYHCGIAMDIYPFDETGTRRFSQRLHCWRGWIFGRLCVLAENATPKLPAGLPRPLKAASRAACRGIHGLLRLLRLDKAALYRRFLAAACRYDGRGTGWLLDMTTPDTIHTVVPDKTVHPLSTIAFEGFPLRTVANPDDYLTRYYGDYLTLPPVSRQHNHLPACLRFED